MSHIARSCWGVLGIIISGLKDYCANSTLAGVGYIANQRLHSTERIFWLLCITASVIGSYYLIDGYYTYFQQQSISLMLESSSPMEKTEYPSVAVCELGYARNQYVELEDIVASLQNNTFDYNFDVEEFLLRVAFQNVYNFNSFEPYCRPYFDCTDCMKCPTDGFAEMARKIRRDCATLFVNCSWNDEPFDCCRYFRPLNTSMGLCFVLNSVQSAERGTEFWLNTEVDSETGPGLLVIETWNSVAFHLQNTEDIPHVMLTNLQDSLANEGYERFLQFSLQRVLNDDGVRNVEPKYRKCRFPDETFPNSAYKYYSFSACATDCLRRRQMALCNCTNYMLAFQDFPACGLDGLICLDQNFMIIPQTTEMQPWKENSLSCNCLPSCEEHEIRIVEKSFTISEISKNRKMSIKMESLPTERYRRQAVPGRLDLVVSVGGILGFFMGASFLSAIELVFFTLKAIAKLFH